MGIFRLFGLAAVGGASVYAYVEGKKARELAFSLNPYEAKLEGMKEGGWTRSRMEIPWTTPVTEQDASHHQFVDLTVDNYHNGITHDVDKQYYTLFVAPPSVVSTRTAFLKMAPYVSNDFGVTEIAGFGGNTAPLRASLLRPRVLKHSLQTVLKALRKEKPEGVHVVAAGHAGIYALELAQEKPELFDSLVLLNPTFRGPLPTAAHDAQNPLKSTAVSIVSAAMWSLFQVPYLGDAMHYWFTNANNIRRQLESHVYVDEEAISEDVITFNQQVAREGYFLPKIAFLTGKTDPLSKSEELEKLLEHGFRVPTMVVMGTAAPATSKQDVASLEKMAELRETSGEGERSIYIETPGALRSYDEYPEFVGQVTRSFVQQYC